MMRAFIFTPLEKFFQGEKLRAALEILWFLLIQVHRRPAYIV